VVLGDGGVEELGAIKWIGHLSGERGLFAGVEFDNPIGSGTGVHHGHRIFTARMKHAAFVAIEDLVRENSRLAASASLAPLAVGERIVFLQDGKVEYGTVKWIGNISGEPSPMAGVEFDNVIGSGSGWDRLFFSRMNHQGLLRAVDYERDATNYGSVQKNLRSILITPTTQLMTRRFRHLTCKKRLLPDWKLPMSKRRINRKVSG